MADTFTYTWANLNSELAHAHGEYTPGPDGSGQVMTVHVTNDWSTACTFMLLQQFNSADPNRPSGWSDPTGNGVRVWPDPPPATQLTVAAGQTEQFDVSALGLVFMVGQTGWYGDDFCTSDGTGPVNLGGEIQLAIGS